MCVIATDLSFPLLPIAWSLTQTTLIFPKWLPLSPRWCPSLCHCVLSVSSPHCNHQDISKVQIWSFSCPLKPIIGFPLHLGHKPNPSLWFLLTLVISSLHCCSQSSQSCSWLFKHGIWNVFYFFKYVMLHHVLALHRLFLISTKYSSLTFYLDLIIPMYS